MKSRIQKNKNTSRLSKLSKENISLDKRISITRIFFISSFFLLLISSIMFISWVNTLGVFNITEPQLKAITAYQPSDNSIVYDRENKKIGEFFSHYSIFIPYENLPKFLVNAIISIEDRNFFHHHGVDFRGIARAVVQRLTNPKIIQGASTITQQIVRSFLLSSEKTMERKIKEIALALHLETKLSKEKIIEIYANALFLGNGANGVGAAAQRYFGKNISQLKPHELALIAGLFQSPSRYNPARAPKLAKKRQIAVIKAMYKCGRISKQTARKLIKKPLKYKNYNPINRQLAPYFIDYIQERTEKLLDKNVKNQGLRIYTTLDTKLQKYANQAFIESKSVFKKAEKYLYKTKSKQNVEGAIIVTDPKTGEILALKGGRNYLNSQFNRSVKALRQPGSAFKPVVYSLALENGYKWSDLLYIDPISVNNYRPKNFSNSFLTETTLLRAFYKSINTPAVEIGGKLGIRSIISQSKKLGINSPIRNEAGVTIGSSEVTLTDMARMYGTFANNGFRTDVIAIKKIVDRYGNILYTAPEIKKRIKRVISPQTSHLMMQGLKTVLRYGTASGSLSKMAKYAAGKTGTSNFSKDNWFCGFTPDMVAIVWVGTDNRLGFSSQATGTSLAVPIWKSFMSRAISGKKPEPFKRPIGIVSKKVNPHFGHLDKNNGIRMYFLKGREPIRTTSDLQNISRSKNYRNLFDN